MRRARSIVDQHPVARPAPQRSRDGDWVVPACAVGLAAVAVSACSASSPTDEDARPSVSVAASTPAAEATTAGACLSEASPDRYELLALGDVGGLGTQTFSFVQFSQEEDCGTEVADADDLACGDFPWRTPTASGAAAVHALGASRWSTTTLELEDSTIRQDVLFSPPDSDVLSEEVLQHTLSCGGEQVVSTSEGAFVVTMSSGDTAMVVDIAPASTIVLSSTGSVEDLLELSSTARQRLPG